MKEIDDSLRRLRTDVIDLYQIHWPDPNTPIAETAGATAELLKAGKICAIGVSNFSPAQMDAFRAVAPLHAVQPPYNLFERAIEADVFPYARTHGLAMLAYGALCRGLLSGRMRADTKFPDTDLRGSADPKFKPPRFAEYLAAVSALDQFAQKRFGKRVIHLALRWVLDRAPNTIALWGARHPNQLDPVADVLGWKIDAGAMAEIDRIVAAACAHAARSRLHGAAGAGGGVSAFRPICRWLFRWCRASAHSAKANTTAPVGGMASATKSRPEVPKGWQRRRRASVIQPPAHRPYRSIAWSA